MAHDTIDSFLARNIGTYNDQLERDFYALNSGIEKHGLFLPAGLELVVPEKKAATPTIRRTPWD